MGTAFINNLVFYGFALNMGLYAAIGYWIGTKDFMDPFFGPWPAAIIGAVFGIVLWLSAMLIRGITALVVFLEHKARSAA